MVPSPRKRVTRASFNQTWDDNDAALLDPSSLPVARIPRGWERKQETKRTEEGREKKIWRRINLRSRAPESTEDEDEEELDARSRAVKRQQHMSPKAMEKVTAKLNGKKRAFKGTRWDRRKSVLPRKKPGRTQDPTQDDQEDSEESDDAQDATGEDLSYESVVDAGITVEPTLETTQILLPDQEDRRSTFTFAMDQEISEDPADHGGLDGLDATADYTQTEDATLLNLFRSPIKRAPAPLVYDEQITYPQLPQSDNEDVEDEPKTLATDYREDEDALNRDDCARDPETMEFPLQQAEVGTTEQEVICNGIEQQKMEDTAPGILVGFNPIVQLSSPAASIAKVQEAFDVVAYPPLPSGSSPTAAAKPPTSIPVNHITPTEEEVEEIASSKDALLELVESVDIDMDDDQEVGNGMNANADEEFTEASMQLNILRDYEQATEAERTLHEQATNDDLAEVELQEDDKQYVTPEVASLDEILEEDQPLEQQVEVAQTPVRLQMEDITDGLTLSFTPAEATPVDPTPRKLHSPPPPPMQSSLDDATMTIALDDDTALLKDFLNRAAASKAEKAAVMTHRRESLQNRRDSDVVRHALSSPRKALEDKDPNSPSKYDNELTLDLSQTLTLSMDRNSLASPTPDAIEEDDQAEDKSMRGSRRSSRAKKSRLPAPASAAPAQAQTSKIAIRRADGTEHVVLKKSDAQELSLLTRANTRKNKQGAFGVTVRLMKLAADSVNLPPLDESTREIVVGKNIRWDEQLAYYQDNPETIAEAESLATPDELSMPDAISTPSAKPKNKVSKNSTPKIRRVRGLGTANGTPAKALLAPTPVDEEEKETLPAPAPIQQLPRPKASKIRKMPVSSAPQLETKLPSLDIVPVGVEPTKERKSRLAAPKKVMLPQPITALPLPAEGKENTQRVATGIVGATPKKGIPAPKVIVPPTVGMESGLPRRRGRKI